MAFVHDTAAHLCTTATLPLSPEAVTLAGSNSHSFHTAIVLLERMLISSSRSGSAAKRARVAPEVRNALWYELAHLHHIIGEDDVLRGIFRSEVRPRNCEH